VDFTVGGGTAHEDVFEAILVDVSGQRGGGKALRGRAAVNGEAQARGGPVQEIHVGHESRVRAVDDIHLASRRPADGRSTRGAQSDLVEAVAVEVADESHGVAELLVRAAAQEAYTLRAAGERRHVVARGVADRGGAEDQIHRTRAGSCHAVDNRNVGDGANEEVVLAIAVEVSGVGVHAVPEIVSSHLAAEENTGVAQTSRVEVRGGVAVLAEEQPHRAGVGSCGGSSALIGRHREVVISVAVNVPEPTRGARIAYKSGVDGSSDGDSDAVGTPRGGVDDVRERPSFAEDDERSRRGGNAYTNDDIIISVVVDVTCGAGINAKPIAASHGNLLDIRSGDHGCQIYGFKWGSGGPAHDHHSNTSLVRSSGEVGIAIFVEVANEGDIVGGSTNADRSNDSHPTSRHEVGEINGGSCSFHRVEEEATCGN